MFTTPIFASGADDVDIGDNIANSLMLDSSLTQYLSKTFIGGTSPADTSSLQKTYDIKCKRGKLATIQSLLSVYGNVDNYWVIYFDATDRLVVYSILSTKARCHMTSTAVFRDPTAWLDICVGVDATLASNRVTIEVNGIDITASFTVTTALALNNISLSYLCPTAGTYVAGIGFRSPNLYYYDGYLASVIIVDGQKLPATNFGRISADTGQWVPKNYTGTYGTNGFRLDFSDSANLGSDSSGNGNNWTLNGGITSANQYTDTPTNNYCVLNPLVYVTNLAYSQGNLKVVSSTGTGTRCTLGSVSVSTGKWYWENTLLNAGCSFGVASAVVNTLAGLGFDAYGWAYSWNIGQKYNNNVLADYGAAFTLGDVIGVALDMDAGTLSFYKNGVSQGVAFSGLTGDLFPAVSDASGAVSASMTSNFGQRPFTYAPPAGFKSLCTANLPTPAIIKPSQHFQTLLDTGANIKTNLAALFSNYFNWIKDRANTNNHQLVDTVRGAAAVLQSNTTAVETTYTAPAGSSVGWAWNIDSVAVANNAGTISSQVSANVLAGQSVVTYTGTGANATVGHGLSKAPELVIVKSREALRNWTVFHASVGATKWLELNGTGAEQTGAAIWNNTVPTSSVFSVGTSQNVNFAEDYLALCFHSVEGYSKVGKYTGNGLADGTFVDCGFKPAFILVKRTDAASSWWITDSARNPSNVASLNLYPESSAVEGAAGCPFDLLAAGFKARSATYNVSAAKYIFIAFAEVPAKYSLAR